MQNLLNETKRHEKFKDKLYKLETNFPATAAHTSLFHNRSILVW